MKAIFKNMIQAYKGKCDGLVYYYNPRLNRILVRPHVKPRPTEQTRRFASISKNLKALAPSEGFKTDLSVYVDIRNRKATRLHGPLQNWYNAYTMMMYALAKTYSVEALAEAPEAMGGSASAPTTLDLSTLTREFIYANELPCISVKRAVEAGLLSSVKGYELLTAEM